MTEQEAIAQLDALTGEDPEADHSAADKILLAYVPDTIAEAYHRVAKRAMAWWYA